MKKIVILLMILLMVVGCGSKKQEEIEVIQTEPVQEVINSTIDYLDALSIWGLDPGLGVKVLHEQGFTGKGVTVAYIDQVIDEKLHNEYADSIVDYIDVSNPKEQLSFHGYAVLSLLCGKNLGVAPDVNVHYYSTNSSNEDILYGVAECFRLIIEKNKTLPEDKKITMVALSNNIDTRPGAEEVKKAEQELLDTGVMVYWCGENEAFAFEEFSDKTNIENIKAQFSYDNPKLCFVPSGSRTRANQGRNIDAYAYDEDGGLSWTMPYTFGLYSIALSIDSSLTQEDIKRLIVDTAQYNSKQMRIVNPIGFVSAVLRRVGRNDEADILEKAYKQSLNYIYAIYNSSKLSNDDINSIREFSNTMINANIVLFDCKDYKDAISLYDAIKDDIKQKEGNIVGMQIFGNPDIVPSFEINYKVDMVGSIDDAGYFYSDLFYQNLNNDSALLNKDYSIYKHFEENLDVDLIPQYPLARLPLAKGEFSSFFNKYKEFSSITHLKKQTLTNFSNPIFASNKHVDDMSFFLNRLKDEFNCIDDDYVLYGNLKGQYPVKTNVVGGFTKDEIKKVNSERITEFLINTHGQIDNIDICYYENDVEKRESLMNKSNINSILDGNYYYLDAWTCNNGTDMKNNIVTTALNGKCMGYFGATHIISNNGVDCYANLDDMKYCNFYYFYYKYLKSINNGYSRSYAFFLAQNAYAKVLLETTKDGMNSANGFNLCNLLDYHNFGVLEPYEYNKDYIEKEDTDLTNTSIKTAVKKYDYIALDGSLLSTFDVDIVDYFCNFNDDGSCIVSLVLQTDIGVNISFFEPPGEILANYKTNTNLSKVECCLSKKQLDIDILMVSVSKADDDRCFISIDPENLKYWNKERKNTYTIEDAELNDQNSTTMSEEYTIDDDNLKTFKAEILGHYYYENENGDYEITFSLNVPNGSNVAAFIPPDNLLERKENVNGKIDFTFTLPKEKLNEDRVYLSVGKGDDDIYFVDIKIDRIKQWKVKKNENYGKEEKFDYTIDDSNLRTFKVEILDYKHNKTKNGDYEITFSLNVPKGAYIGAFIPPDNILESKENVNGKIDFTFTLESKYLNNDVVCLSVGKGDNDRYFITINIDDLIED